MKNFFVTVPHSGEKIPEEVLWLSGLEEPVLMRDVDRYVDQLYSDFCRTEGVDFIFTPWHRYVVDLNRRPDDVDKDSVLESAKPSGTHTTGLHWVKTTLGEVLMKEPIEFLQHQKLVELYHRPFHASVEEKYSELLKCSEKVYQLDAHSMPSLGTAAHRDNGHSRAEIVVSDRNGVSCSSSYRELVCGSYQKAGFEVKENWPYLGGRVTETYGQPEKGQHCIQVELNRKLYMCETTKKKKEAEFLQTKEKIEKALALVKGGISKL